MEVITEAQTKKLAERGQSTLLIARELSRASAFAMTCRADTAIGVVSDPRGFTTILCAPQTGKLTDLWQDIVLLDGHLLPGEADAIRARCPSAHLHALKPNAALMQQLQQLAMDDETLRNVYRQLRKGGDLSARRLSQALSLTEPQILTALTAFSEVQLVQFSLLPYAVVLLPPVKCRMDDSPTLRYIRAAAAR